jgi:hypothetical protein
LPGQLQVTVTLKKVPVGTELKFVQEGLPDVLPLDACYLGRRVAAKLGEARRA